MRALCSATRSLAFRRQVSSTRCTAAASTPTHQPTTFALARSLDIGVEIVQCLFPEETGVRLASRRFRLCHLDVDTHDSFRDAFERTRPRIVPGGIVVADDYGFGGCEGVTPYVDGMRGEPDRVIFHNL